MHHTGVSRVWVCPARLFLPVWIPLDSLRGRLKRCNEGRRVCLQYGGDVGIQPG